MLPNRPLEGLMREKRYKNYPEISHIKTQTIRVHGVTVSRYVQWVRLQDLWSVTKARLRWESTPGTFPWGSACVGD
jgi:hypothetical protein